MLPLCNSLELVRKGFLTCLPDKELALYRLVEKLLREGPGFLRDLSDETLYPVAKAIRHLNGEVHQLKAIHPLFRAGRRAGQRVPAQVTGVLPLLRSHFGARYREERFFLYDRTHREALFYAAEKAVIRPLSDFQMAPPDAKEAHYRLLWKRFYDTIAIQEAYHSLVGRRTHMPQRYWSTMTEFQPEAYFKAESSPADAASPAVPGGTPAPGILPGSEPPAPGSAP